MIDIILPQVPVKEFISLAERLRLKGLYVATGKKENPLKISFPLYQGMLQLATGDVRKEVERGKVDIVYDVELSPRQDFVHARNSGLDQVLCKLMQQRKAIYTINFSQVVQTQGTARATLIGRMQQNVRLCRKYKVPMAIATFAQEPLQLRSPKDLQAFCRLLGMHSAEAEQAANILEEHIARNLKKKSGKLPAEGVELVA